MEECSNEQENSFLNIPGQINVSKSRMDIDNNVDQHNMLQLIGFLIQFRILFLMKEKRAMDFEWEIKFVGCGCRESMDGMYRLLMQQEPEIVGEPIEEMMSRLWMNWPDSLSLQAVILSA